jgi:hypothetical protein
MVPDGERWGQCIANRAFKTRVIDLVLLRLPALLLAGHPKRRLIVDYREPAEFRFCPAAGTVQREAIPELPPMGEADLKFTRHASRHGRLVVDSIDGDSIPIALMHYEQELRRATPPPLIAVLRLELRLPGEPSAASKRKAGEKPQGGGRTYEYVNIHALYTGLKDTVAQSTGRIRVPTHAGHEMAMLVALIALTGTDFSRNLPQMSGRTVYGWLPDVWPALALAYDPGAGRLQEGPGGDLVALLYRTKFPKHARARALEAVLADAFAQLVLVQRPPSLVQETRQFRLEYPLRPQFPHQIPIVHPCDRLHTREYTDRHSRLSTWGKTFGRERADVSTRK